MILQGDRANDRSSALLAYTYKCFVLPSESKLIASISGNTETNAILHAMAGTDGNTAQIVRRMKNALCKAHICSSGADIVFWDEDEQREKLEWKISADELSRLVCELYKNKDELLSV